MSKIITFCSSNSSMGKTTNAVQVAYELSKRNAKTLLVDLDPQANATNILLKTKANIDTELAHFESSLMVAVQNKNLESSIITVKNNLDLMGSAPDFALFPRYMEKMFPSSYINRVKYLSTLLVPLAKKYDYVIIDIPSTISLITDAALYASDWCLIVMQTQLQAFDETTAFIDYIQDNIINKYKAPKLDALGILPVLIQAGVPVDSSMLKKAIDQFGQENVLPTPIHFMQCLKRYGIDGISIDKNYGKNAFKMYQKVTDEILARIHDSNMDTLDSIDVSAISKNSPFAKKEKTHPIRIRDSHYEKIRLLAFKRKQKMIDVLDEMLQKTLEEESQI